MTYANEPLAAESKALEHADFSGVSETPGRITLRTLPGRSALAAAV
jgi:hypothetical protein